MPELPEWIAHPEEWGVFLLVAVIALIGLFFLYRLTFGGARAAARATLPAKSFRHVLLPATERMAWTPGAVALACRLAGSGASVLLAYIIEVPRALALDADLPEEEAQARRALTRASEMVRKYGLPVQAQIRKARVAVEETLRAAGEEKADLLVLIVADDKNEDADSPLAARAEELARRAPCEVVFARAAAEG